MQRRTKKELSGRWQWGVGKSGWSDKVRRRHKQDLVLGGLMCRADCLGARGGEGGVVRPSS